MDRYDLTRGRMLAQYQCPRNLPVDQYTTANQAMSEEQNVSAPSMDPHYDVSGAPSDGQVTTSAPTDASWQSAIPLNGDAGSLQPLPASMDPVPEEVETQEDPSELFAINISEGRAPIPVGRLDVLHPALLRVLMHPLSEDFSPTYTLILDGFAAGQGVESMGIRNWFFRRHEAERGDLLLQYTAYSVGVITGVMVLQTRYGSFRVSGRWFLSGNEDVWRPFQIAKEVLETIDQVSGHY